MYLGEVSETSVSVSVDTNAAPIGNLWISAIHKWCTLSAKLYKSLPKNTVALTSHNRASAMLGTLPVSEWTSDTGKQAFRY